MARPRDTSAYDPRWNSWLLARVDGQFTGTTDEIFQWAACKWGLSDNLLRAVAVNESTWYQYETYPTNRCVVHFSCGDIFAAPTAGSATYCNAIAEHGHDYQADLGAGICPQTFGIVGVKSWQAPSWGPMPDNQNGTFPFARDSTAFAVDYFASQLRGCYEGWERFLANTERRTYAPGHIWGCVGVWYSGDWRSAAAESYVKRVRGFLRDAAWLARAWPADKPGCHPAFGCPGPDSLGS